MASAGRGSAGMLPREIFEKSVQLGAFWHICMQFDSFSEASFFTGKVIKF